MGILKKIRPKESPKKENYFIIIAGLFFLISGLICLFIDSQSIFDSELMASGYGFAPIPIVLLTFMGWTFFGYGVLNLFDWSKYEGKLSRLKSIKIFGKLSVKNRCFILLSIAFFTLITSTYVIAYSIGKDRTGDEELYKAIREFQKTMQSLDSLKNK